MLSIFFAPHIIPRPQASQNTSKIKQDLTDRVIIPALNLEVPYASGDAKQLDNGAWYRFPERGAPDKDGNFILSGHRFVRDWTPQSTAKRSYFYFLDKAKVGDKVFVVYQKKLYEYKVTQTKRVTPFDVSIEATSKEPRLTLYTCTAGGSFDGRIVVIAKLISSNI